MIAVKIKSVRCTPYKKITAVWDSFPNKVFLEGYDYDEERFNCGFGITDSICHYRL